jgi:CubicO group peptidase (beta-lactamase class C family)
MRRMQARSLKRLMLAATGLALLAALLGPKLWQRSSAPRLERAAEPRYEPRELVPGGNSPPAPRVAPELESLDRAGLEAAAAYAGAHGSRALIVSRHDHIVFERYWQGNGFDTLADAQSFTRLLAALAVGVAISHRLIGWPDEPVGAFIGEWRQDPRAAITVRNLLQSSSGLARPQPAPRGTDLIAPLLRTPLAAAPGGTRTEQATDPQLLALVIERAAKERYASYLSQVLWRRIGAADAWLRLERPGGAAHADCCMLARQGDWMRIGELLVRDGNYRGDEVIRPGWVALLRAPSRADPHHGAYLRLATSLAPGEDPYLADDLFLVGGEGGNRLWLVPSLQLAVLCTGAPAGRDAAWSDSRVPNLIVGAVRDLRPRSRLPPADVSALVPGH